MYNYVELNKDLLAKGSCWNCCASGVKCLKFFCLLRVHLSTLIDARGMKKKLGDFTEATKWK